MKKSKNNINSEQSCRIAAAKKTSIGGQALLEGIMMRGPKMTAMAVRTPDGEITLEKWETTTKPVPKIFKLPIIRGVYGFVSSMTTGYKALMRSAEIAGLDEIEEEMAREKAAKKAAKKAHRGETAEESSAAEVVTEEPAVESASEQCGTDDTAKQAEETLSDNILTTENQEKKKASGLTTAVMLIASFLGVVIAVGLFVVFPTFLYKLLPFPTFENMALNSLIKSAFEGILKIAMLIAYMALVSLMKDIKRTFQYHGAEHKTIFCYESGTELTVENVRKQRRFHPRCGTAFLILMLIVSIFISFFIDPIFYWTLGYLPNVLIRAGIKILLLPLIMGLGYELIKVSGRHDNIFTRIISAPGLWLQRITVLEPTDDMIECAILAFKEVIPEDQSDNY